jgi:hypothetical protein
MTIIVRYCKKHGNIFDKCYVINGRIKCKECRKEASTRYRQKNRSSILEYRLANKLQHNNCTKKWRSLNKKHIRIYTKHRYRYNKHVRLQHREKSRRAVNDLKDGYIIKQLKRSHRYTDSEITPELIELKRATMLLRRKILEIKKHDKEANHNA